MTNRVIATTATPAERPKGLTPAQTVGPFFHYILTPHSYATRAIFTSDLTSEGVTGERIAIEGRVFDGDGEPVPDAMIEIWQADSEGRYAHPDDRRAPASNAFRGFGRCDTDAEGRFRFVTVKPGIVPGPKGAPQSPHIAVNVFGRGMLKHLVTRIYFDSEAANAGDPVLSLVSPGRRGTLIAQPIGADSRTYRFDIRLQGEGETVFFDL